ncbi:MAG: hypothetical protein HY964_04495 [Ignavibacteriales bacterium]|nr:hypothetical protein [Ignavibacteriales bacterium]
MKKKIFYFIIFLLTFLFGCKSIEISSYWRDREIKIDGDSGEWNGKTWVVDDYPNMAFGFMNDENYLYLSLTISDRALQRQIAMMGLTVWFDRNGGEEKQFGVRYPVGMEMREMQMERRKFGQNEEHNLDNMPQFPEKFSDDIEIFGPMENEHQLMRIFETGGIEVALRFQSGLLVYEMKIPLQDKGPKPYVIGAAAGSVIGVGIETNKRDMPEGRGERPMMGGGPGGGGMGGRRGEGRGNEPRSGTEGMKEPLKLWAKVKLAIQDSTSH